MMRLSGYAVALCVVLLVRSSGHAQAPLSLDTTFRMDLPAQNVFSLACMPNGQLLISGNMEFPGETNVWPLSRINPDGSRDMSIPFTFGGAKLTSWQDRFFVAGAGTVRRLMPDGTIDNDFQNMNSDPYFISGQGGDYHVFPDGRVLLGGYHSLDAQHLGVQGDYNLVWFFSNGRLDTTRIHRTGNGTVWRIREYPVGTTGGLDGKFLVHHWGTHYEGQPVSKVFRVHADGGLDESFDAPIEWGFALAMEPIADGRAYVGGLFRLENSPDTLQLVRLMPDGSLDPGFNNALHFEKAPGTYDIAPGVLCVYPIGPGLIAVTGNFNEVDDHPRGGICVLDTLGNVVDHYLDDAGCAAYDFPIGMTVHTYAIIQGITRAPDGDYYIWGAYHGYNDGTTSDTLQRMVTRLHGGEIGLGVPQQRPQPELVLSLKPNPANAWVVVSYDLLNLQSAQQFVIRDALGRAVHQAPLASVAGQALVDTRGMPAGAYTVELRQGALPVVTERLIIQP